MRSSCWATASILSAHLRQLILNPLKGHPQAARSIHNPDFLETLRELAAMDGAFVVNRRGVVDSAGTYLNAPVGQGRLSPGLGARHAAALAITTVTDATAVVISASSGTVSVYDGGETVLELDAPIRDRELTFAATPADVDRFGHRDSAA